MSVHYNPRTRYQTPPGAERWEAEHIYGRRRAAIGFVADYREAERRAAELAARKPPELEREHPSDLGKILQTYALLGAYSRGAK